VSYAEENPVQKIQAQVTAKIANAKPISPSRVW
jgi:hypothetical protein